MRRPKSDIPDGATERVIQKYNRNMGLIRLERRECTFNGELVGYRCYDDKGRLQIETPLEAGKKHGREIHWNDDGTLNFIEPYSHGKMHGAAKQYENGRVIGTYKMVHGTGYDVWRNQIADGPVYVSEIHSMRDGMSHGFEWWLNDDQKSVHEEKHWYEGTYHGIEREWHWSGKLRRGYPKYWIGGEAVTKRQYVRAARKDPTLPPFHVKENSPRRKFPLEIKRLLKMPKKK
jgi:hypothetical protein